jgi:drug/metabolite transporter (DMT)-like permease
MTVALALCAAVGWAFVTLRMAGVSRGLDPAVAMFVILGASLLMTAPLGLVLDGSPPGDGRGLAASAIAGLLEMTGFLCYLKAVQRGSMAVVAPLIGLEGGVAAVIAVIGGEAVSATLAFGIVTAAVGASLACASRGERTSAGAGWAILAGLQFGVMLTLFGATGELGAFTAVSVARLTALVVLVPVLLSRRRPPTPRLVLRTIAVCGLVDALAFGAFVAAATRGPVSVASVCAAQFSTLSVIVAIVVLRERPAKVQLVGIALTLVGTTVLAAV